MPKVLGSSRKISSSIRSEVTKIEGESKCKWKYCWNVISCKVERIRTHVNIDVVLERINKKTIVSQNESSVNFKTKNAHCSQSETLKLNLCDELASSSSATNAVL